MPRKNKQQRLADEARYEAALEQKALMSNLFECYDTALRLGWDICQLTADMELPTGLREKIELMGTTIAEVENIWQQWDQRKANDG